MILAKRRPGVLRALTRTVAISLPLATIFSFMTPTTSQAFGFWTGVCSVTVTLSFDHPVTTTPTTVGIDLRGVSAGNCVSQPSPTIATFFGLLAGAVSCDSIASTSGTVMFSFTTAPSATTTLVTGAGPAGAQGWVFPGISPSTFDAAANLAWTNTNEIAACRSSGTSQMTLTGILVYQDPDTSPLPQP